MIKMTVKYELQAVEILKKNLMHEAKRLLDCPTLPLVESTFMNMGRYCILRFKYNKKCIKYAILFKKEFFHSFGKMFKEVGEGETINADFYLRIRDDSEKIIFVHQHKEELKIRSIVPEMLKKLGEKGYLHEYVNQSDHKKQICFNKVWLSEI